MDAMQRTDVKAVLFVTAVIIAVVTLVGSWAEIALAEPIVAFEMNDPIGDDYGPGTYTYPTHKAFLPGLFDLTSFRVSYDVEYVYFDTTFREVTNTWNAPEGFSHQLINIYIDTTKGLGRTDTIRKGAMVAFDKRYGWDILIKALGWGGCRAFTSNDGEEAKGISDGLEAGVLPDGETVRVKVPLPIIGQPEASWGYYVLIGSQDAFGDDDFRPVMEEASSWTFGGGSNLEFSPNVIDMLAPEGGRFSQERLLGSYDAGKGVLAVLVPVSAGMARRGVAFFGLSSTPMIIVTVAGLLLVGGAVVVWIRRKGFGVPPN
jgi:carbohydrate-binding DOMON domain-containing protein